MTTRAALEVLDEVQFRYPEDRRYTYVIPAGLTLNADEAWCLSGVSGSGKTTLMTLLATLRRFQAGRIRYRFSKRSAVEVTPADWEATVGPRLWRRIGFAFQRPELIRSLDVGDNLALTGGSAAGGLGTLFSDEEWQRIDRSRVWRISGGQIQRLGLARAFGEGQDLIFLDEPTNNLDVRNRRGVARFVESVRRGRALVVVSHDEDFLQALGIDRVLIIVERADGSGGIRRILTDTAPAVAAPRQRRPASPPPPLLTDRDDYPEGGQPR